MAKSEKQVADPKSADIVPMESLFEADAGRGNENISQDDLATPFLKILSGNDPILDVHETARKGDTRIMSPIAFIRARTAFALFR